ncbi:MAG: hypothetical protein JW809_08425 [Pirellulales bacterium]|nr:hypothetical protein [Pirellulales bacterium]
MSQQDVCRLLIDPPASGGWNMAVDEAMLESAGERACCVWRFYQWAEPTLSLGYFQAASERQCHPASGSCPLVRRASGGGALVHDEELTYSLALPLDHRLARGSRRDLYLGVHRIIIHVAKRWGVEVALAKEEASAAGRPFLCFQRRAPGDVLCGAHKIAGSAQRRTPRAILQHGSLLLARSAAAPELPGLVDLAGRSVEIPLLVETWLAEMAQQWGLKLASDGLDAREQARARMLVETKYAEPGWTFDRRRPDR